MQYNAITNADLKSYIGGFMKRIAVFGAGGVMASGIIESLLIHSNVKIVAFEKNPDSLAAAPDKLWNKLYLARGQKRKLLYKSAEEVNAAANKVEWFNTDATNIAAYISNCDAAIEAIFEDEAEKKTLYALIEKYARPDMPIFTNTSTIGISRLAEGMVNPKRLVGLHFFNPVPQMPLIEAIVQQIALGDHDLEVEKATADIAKAAGKHILWAPDLPGFVVNGVWVPAIRIAVEEIERGANFEEIDKAFRTGTWVEYAPARRVVEELIKSAEVILEKQEKQRCGFKTNPENIDKLLELGTKMPAGPFKLKALLEKNEAQNIRFELGPAQFIDLVGIDVALDCIKSMARQEPDRGWKEPELLLKMLEAKTLGKKTGKGFYEYGSRVEIDYPEQGYARVRFGDGKRNVLALDIVKKLNTAFLELENRKDLRAIFLEGFGEIFSQGANIEEFPLCLKNEKNSHKAISSFHNLMNRIAEIKTPVIAVVRSKAYGGGYELPLACDTIVAEKRAELWLPEVGLGIFPGAGGTQRLPRRVGIRLAMDMVLNTKKIEASLPWVDCVMEKENMTWENLKKIAGTVKKRSFDPIRYSFADKLQMFFASRRAIPESARLAYEAMRKGNEREIWGGLLSELHAIIAAFKTKDAEDGIRHFLETKKHLFAKND